MSITAVLVGSSNHAGFYIDRFREDPGLGARLCAVVDPYAKASPHYPWILVNRIPVFDALEDYYAARGGADLVIISSPIQFHRRQAETAMKNGSAVLCEKPLCATVADAEALRVAWDMYGVPFGVGFQWSFSTTMIMLKRDILNGVYGGPVELKTLVSWPRGDAYYDPKGWKGKLRDRDGNAINDSVAMNATAHYLHNMLFLTGGGMSDAACPVSISGSLYRARDIESFDTCFMRGELEGGCALLYCVSHSAPSRVEPRFEYRFEKGTVTFDGNTDGVVRATLDDGGVREYGEPQSPFMTRCALTAMIDAARTGTQPVCGIGTILPHLRVCEAMLEGFGITDFPADIIERRSGPDGVCARGLNDAMEHFYNCGVMPDKAASGGAYASWAATERVARIN